MKMFKTFAVIGVLASAASAYAGDDSRYLHVNVPFAFVVGSEQFAPGTYNVRQTESGIVTVQGQGKSAAFLSAPLETAKAGDVSGLRFTNNASREYLFGDIDGRRRHAVRSGAFFAIGSADPLSSFSITLAPFASFHFPTGSTSDVVLSKREGNLAWLPIHASIYRRERLTCLF